VPPLVVCSRTISASRMTVILHATDGICSVDPDGQVRTINLMEGPRSARATLEPRRSSQSCKLTISPNGIHFNGTVWQCMAGSVLLLVT
jgi:hypothetical protein